MISRLFSNYLYLFPRVYPFFLFFLHNLSHILRQAFLINIQLYLYILYIFRFQDLSVHKDSGNASSQRTL